MAPHYDLSLGVLQIGALISTLLYGVMNMQAYTYYTTDVQGCRRVRALATLVWFLETLHVVVSWIYLYSITVIHYGQPAYLTIIPWSLSSAVVIGGAVATVAQAFFTYRLWRLSHSVHLAIIGWTLALIHFAAIVTAGVTAMNSAHLGAFMDKYMWIALVAISDSLLLDVFNTIGLCYYLNAQQSGFDSPSPMLDKIIAWTLETSLITSVVCSVMLISCAAMPRGALWIAVDMFYAKIFSNSLFASLNAGRRFSLSLANQRPDFRQAVQQPRLVMFQDGSKVSVVSESKHSMNNSSA
ncbi:hypothetical protein PUNSTDRAFT_52369 [Punctularia strigosozonata HHB-11173 SS5]|uniref:uncharacterized protein n=1 Tax=Punctularia strigosozonata (strain HHB-11173) TaxID=741275 RepID=UPI0004416EAB|nr:uncharacterized protein PUNSTDRAFT_52369 [Punctularia strigosozonata HHB-11173 SS5]EIN08905.1 hypothetical protein PUNSTDRAFT_52369 [Punctularia strigosozonata HHB-11173 SS5]